MQGKLAKNFRARITKFSAVWLKKCLGYEEANKSSQSDAAPFFFSLTFFDKQNENVYVANAETYALCRYISFFQHTLKRRAETFYYGRVCAACVREQICNEANLRASK